MARAGIILVGIFMAFLITDTYSAPNKRHTDGKDEEETTDHVPWLEQGIKTGDIPVSGGVNGQRSLHTEELPQGVSEAWEDLKLASMKVANAAKKTSQLLEGGKRNDEDMVRLALEDEVKDAKSYLKKADSKMRAAMGMPSSEQARGSAYAMAVASVSHSLTQPSSTEDRLTAEDDDYDDCEQNRMSKRGKKKRSKYNDEEMRRKRKRSRGKKRQEDYEEHMSKKRQDDDYEEHFAKKRQDDDYEEHFAKKRQDDDYEEGSLPELSEDDYKALFRSAPEPSDEETLSRRASPASDILSVLQGAQCDLTEVIQSSIDSLLGYLSKKIKPGKNNNTDSTGTESEGDSSPPVAGSEKRSENIFGIEDGIKTPLPELDMFNPLEIAVMLLRNFDQKMIKQFVSTLVETNL